MNPAYRDILKHSAIYGVGQILARLASFLMLPLYTHYLRPADYGCIAILDLTCGIMGIVIGAGVATAVNRYHFEATSDHQRDQVWWTGLTFVVIMATMIVAPAWLVRQTIARWTLGAEQLQGSYYFALVLPTLWLGVIAQVPQMYLRVRKWSGLYVTLSVLGLILNLTLNVTFLVVFQMGIAGVLWGNLCAGVVATAAVLSVFVATRGSYAFDRLLLVRLWRFGSPLVVTSLLAMIMHQADRYVLRAYLDLDQVGIYSLAYTIGQAVNTLVLLPFAQIWAVMVYEIAEMPNAKRIYTRVFQYFVYGLALVMFGVSLFAKPIVSLMAAPDYAAAAGLIPIVCLAYLFFSLHGHFNVPALLAKRTSNLLPAYAIAAVANLLMNVLMIPAWGTYGAAWASVLTFALFSLVGLLIYRRIDRFDYAWGRCGIAVGGMVASVAVLQNLPLGAVTPLRTMAVSLALWSAWALVLFGPVLRTFLKRAPEDVKPATSEGIGT